MNILKENMKSYMFEYTWNRNIIICESPDEILLYLQTNKVQLKAVYFCEKIKKKTYCMKYTKVLY